MTETVKAPIEVFVSNHDISSAKSEASAKLLVFDRCIKAGMPLNMDPFSSSIFALQGVLITTEDYARNGLTVRWEPEPPPKPVTVWSRVKRIAKAIWEF